MDYRLVAEMPSVVNSIITSSSQGEAALIEQAKQGSTSAWDALYTAHSTAIYRYINARVFEPDIAEDLTSEVFISAIKGVRSYRQRGQPFLAWLYRIARNTVNSYQRTLLRRQGIASRGLVANLFGRRQAPADEGGGPQVVVASDRESGMDPALLELRQALWRLNRAQREVVVLRFFVGLSTEEIAQVLGKSTAAVYSLQSRAMGALREELS